MSMELKYKYLAEDQYGDQTWIVAHPRKELCEKYGSSHISKMYIDDKDGNAHHVGYVVAGHWCNVYAVAPAFA